MAQSLLPFIALAACALAAGCATDAGPRATARNWNDVIHGEVFWIKLLFTIGTISILDFLLPPGRFFQLTCFIAFMSDPLGISELGI